MKLLSLAIILSVSACASKQTDQDRYCEAALIWSEVIEAQYSDFEEDVQYLYYKKGICSGYTKSY